MHPKTGKFARGNKIIKLGISNLRTNVINLNNPSVTARQK